jgi:hypothetical protein
MAGTHPVPHPDVSISQRHSPRGGHFRAVQIFGTTLADQDADVRLITLRALGKIAEYIESDQKDLVVSVLRLITILLV